MDDESEVEARERINREAPKLVELVVERLKLYADWHPETVTSRLRVAGVSESFFRDLRRGKTGKGVTLMTVVRIALALGVEPQHLFGRHGGKKRAMGYPELVAEALEGAVLDPLDGKGESI